MCGVYVGCSYDECGERVLSVAKSLKWTRCELGMLGVVTMESGLFVLVVVAIHPSSPPLLSSSACSQAFITRRKGRKSKNIERKTRKTSSACS